MPSSKDRASRALGLGACLLALVSGTAGADAFAGRELHWQTVRHPDVTLPVMGDVIHAQGRYIAAGEGTLMESEDGSSWQTVFTDPDLVWGPTIYGGGRFVSNGGSALAVSSDGIQWQEIALPSEDSFFFLAYGNGVYIATGVECTPAACARRVFTSPDLASWTGHDLAAVTADGPGPIAFNGSEFMVLTDDSAGDGKWVLSSSDGIGWTAHMPHVPAHTAFLQLRAVNGRFMALGGYNDQACVEPLLNNLCPSPYLAMSDDGEQWQSVQLKDPLRLFADVTYAGGQYLAVMEYDQGCGICQLSFKLLASSDGVHWGLARGVPEDAEPLSVATDGRTAVEVGVHGSIITAPDAGSSGNGALDGGLLALLSLILLWRRPKP